MSAPSHRVITIFGGSGFIGRQLLRSLSAQPGAQDLVLRLASRSAASQPPSYWKQLAPQVKHIHPVQCDISQPKQVVEALQGATDVVNCVGILYETPSRGSTFDNLQFRGPKNIADALVDQKETVNSLIHVSAIGAEINSKSMYAKTKALGEEQIQRVGTPANVTILRPSIVFGQEDSFFNRFEQLSRFLPFLPLVGGGSSKYQPVHVNDVVKAIIASLRLGDSEVPIHGLYELGGNDVFTFKQLMELVLQVTGRRRLLLPIPFPVASMQGALFETIHGMAPSVPPMLTRDQVELLKSDNVVPPQARGLRNLGIEPTACSAENISYIK